MAHTNFLAYLDGGTGSMLMQAAIAGALSASFILKTQWQRLRAMFDRRRVGGTEQAEG
jgi:hypothetical protein